MTASRYTIMFVLSLIKADYLNKTESFFYPILVRTKYNYSKNACLYVNFRPKGLYFETNMISLFYKNSMPTMRYIQSIGP